MRVCSKDKGLEEKDYAFSLDFYSEVTPEVRRSPLRRAIIRPDILAPAGITQKPDEPFS